MKPEDFTVGQTAYAINTDLRYPTVEEYIIENVGTKMVDATPKSGGYRFAFWNGYCRNEQVEPLNFLLSVGYRGLRLFADKNTADAWLTRYLRGGREENEHVLRYSCL